MQHANHEALFGWEMWCLISFGNLVCIELEGESENERLSCYSLPSYVRQKLLPAPLSYIIDGRLMLLHCLCAHLSIYTC